MATHKLSILVEAIGAAKASAQLKGVDRTISQIGAHSGQGIRTAADNLTRLGVVGAGIAVVGITAAVKAAGDFEAQLNTINTIARAMPGPLDAIGDGIRKMARDTGTGLDDLTSAYYDLLSAGIKTADAQKVLQQANTLAIGGLATTSEAVDLLTTAINSYGGDASKAAEYTDDFAKAIELGKVKASDIAATFADVASVAAQNGIKVREIAAAYADLTAQGVPAAEVTTQMQRAIIELLKPNSDLIALQKKVGTNYHDLAAQKGLVPALQQMRIDAEKAGVPFETLLGRVEGYKFALETTGQANAKFNDVMAQMGKDSGTAAAQMAERQKGLNHQLDLLKANAIDAAITIGDKLLPKITPLAARAVAFLNTHQADISAFGDKIAAAFDKALAFAERIPWDSIGAGLEMAASWAGKLMDVFLGMPPEVQSTIIALAGLNKLSGGAISNIVGDLSQGLIKGVLGINAGVVNVRGAVVNGGGLPGSAGAAAEVGGASKLVQAVRILGAVSIAAGSIYELVQVFSQVTQDTREQAQGVRATAQAEIANKTTTDVDLVKALEATDKGIADILALGPVGVILAGDALEELKKQHADIVAALDARKHTATDDLAGRRAASNAQSAVTLAGKSADDLAAVAMATARQAEALKAWRSAETKQGAELLAALAGLRKATAGKDIQAQARAIVRAITHGAGNVTHTEGAVTELKAAQGRALAGGDKALAAEIGRYIRQVEAKLPNRRYVEGQFAAAKQIEASTASTESKLADLRSIQADLRAHGDTHAAGIIGQHIDTMKSQNAASASATTAAVDSVAAKTAAVTATLNAKEWNPTVVARVSVPLTVITDAMRTKVLLSQNLREH